MYSLKEIDINILLKVKEYVNENYIESNECEDYEEDSCSDTIIDDLQVSFSSFPKLRRLQNIGNSIDNTWQETVFYFIDQKKFFDPDVYKRANISKQTFSKIRSDINYQPNKDTAIQMCFGLKLNIDETCDLLEKAGFALSSSLKRDLVVKYFIEEKIYDLMDLNIVLQEMGLKLFPIN